MGKEDPKIKVSDEGYVSIKVNPLIYPLDTIYSAAYIFLDKAYIRIDGDPKKEIIIELKPKTKTDLETLGREFNNELLNYAFYKIRAEKSKDIRTAIIQRALLTNDPCLLEDETDKILNKECKLEDPEDIARPWEEKYGKNAKD